MDFDSLFYTDKLDHNTFVIKFLSARGRGSLLLQSSLQVKLPSSKWDTKRGNAEVLQAVFLSSCNIGEGPNKPNVYTKAMFGQYANYGSSLAKKFVKIKKI